MEKILKDVSKLVQTTYITTSFAVIESKTEKENLSVGETIGEVGAYAEKKFELLREAQTLMFQAMEKVMFAQSFHEKQMTLARDKGIAGAEVPPQGRL